MEELLSVFLADSEPVRQAPERIERAMFEPDGKILLLTRSSTLRLAADGSQLAGERGKGMELSYLVGDYFGGTFIIEFTADHKLLVARNNSAGGLMVRRYLLD